MYLLDTNVLSELRRPKPHGGVVHWLTGQQHEDLFIAAASIGEIAFGIEHTRKNSPARALELTAWMESLPRVAAILTATDATFRIWGRIA